jgi:hypothetical protein
MFRLYFLALLFFPFYSKACDDNLRRFPFECLIQDQFGQVRAKFNTITDNKIHIQNLSIYKTLQLIHINDWKGAIDSYRYMPWQIYSPKPETWLLWENGLACLTNLLPNILLHKKITKKHLAVLHKNTINEEILGVLKSTAFRFTGQSFVASPGLLRSKTIFPSYFTVNLTNQQRKLLQNYDIKNQNGTPMLRSLSSLTHHRVFFPNSSLVEEELDLLLTKINRYIEKFFQNEPRIISPYRAMAQFQRHFVAIHPFSEGVGRVSRFLQDTLATLFGLPKLRGGYLQDDILSFLKDYQDQTLQEATRLIKDLTSCTKEYQEFTRDKKSISANCSPISRRFEYYDPRNILEEKFHFIVRIQEQVKENSCLKQFMSLE